ncbi:hypothetical protein [Megamonas hypermegale]|uniref:hypothetical protein n=1 Tax=Megamonas hypermegale TaxID=158847 RepID=UPI0026EBB62F|nr:hypothetical protein [Megamonas hypermegale]
MFIAGIVGGVVVGVVAHGDYSDHSDHAKYSDMELVMNIEAIKENKLSQKQKELDRIYDDILSRYREELSILSSENILSRKINIIRQNKELDNINNIGNISDELTRYIKSKLENELSEDKKQLAEIDAALVKINAIQLTDKR